LFCNIQGEEKDSNDREDQGDRKGMRIKRSNDSQSVWHDDKEQTCRSVPQLHAEDSIQDNGNDKDPGPRQYDRKEVQLAHPLIRIATVIVVTFSTTR